jgi:adenylate cyclase
MKITFEDQQVIAGGENKNVLEMALEQGVDITHVCKGNARCSTCRVLVVDGEGTPRTEKEQILAERLGLPENVRLSCQMQMTSDIEVRRLIKDSLDRKLVNQANSAVEKSVAILFSDIRSFTTFSERHLPYDIVHILNRYFWEMGEAIQGHDGRIDKYMGDGIMAIFGLTGDTHPAVSAYHAAQEMLQRLTDFNQWLADSYGEHFEIGIGIHYGTVVVGDLGHPDSISFTAIGDTVNVAARIESATKNRCKILVSEPVYQVLDASEWDSTELLLKGKTEPLRLFMVPEES